MVMKVLQNQIKKKYPIFRMSAKAEENRKKRGNKIKKIYRIKIVRINKI